jgi:hypothetical protein
MSSFQFKNALNSRIEMLPYVLWMQLRFTPFGMSENVPSNEKKLRTSAKLKEIN